VPIRAANLPIPEQECASLLGRWPGIRTNDILCAFEIPETRRNLLKTFIS
jgi:hypothetical protein